MPGVAAVVGRTAGKLCVRQVCCAGCRESSDVSHSPTAEAPSDHRRIRHTEALRPFMFNAEVSGRPRPRLRRIASLRLA